VPLFVPATSARETSGTIYIWVGAQQGESLDVGLDDENGAWIDPIAPGNSGKLNEEELQVTLVNQSDELSLTRGGGAMIIIEGIWPATRSFALRLTGNGTAGIWLQSEGDLAPEVSVGALVPRAFKEGTINIPASAPDLIAVGATLNRTAWLDYEGNEVSLPQHGALDDAPDDTTAFFSSAGPNALGGMKPDLSAPGANVIGAMSRFADPREVGGGVFDAFGRCPAGAAFQCFVVDDRHAVTGGTSMAAPIVAGAIALLFERDPTLDQHQVRALLQAGARQPSGVVFVEQQLGAGVLDLEATLLAQIAENSPSERLPGSASALLLAASYAKPDPSAWLWVLAELRDDAGAPADGFDPRRLGVAVHGGALASPLERRAPGLHQFAVTAPEGSGGGELEVSLLFDGAPIATRSAPIAVDRTLAQHGVTARGGCTLGRTPASAAWLASLALLFTAWRSRRSRRVARTGPRRDRRDATG
jgi:hypothetical protein